MASEVVTPENLVSLAEHEQGFKEVEVEFRSGRKAAWPMKAPAARVARAALFKLMEGRDESAITRLCLPEGVLESDLDTLTLDALALVEQVAVELAFGSDGQKKMAELVRSILTMISAASSASRSASPPAATVPPNSEPGASPSSGSTSTSATAN